LAKNDFLGTCSKCQMSENNNAQNRNFGEQVVISYLMGLHSANFNWKIQRIEWGVADLYLHIVACRFRDSRTVYSMARTSYNRR
jgi:hypothetical protein